MTIPDELKTLAHEIAGAGWREKVPHEWNPDEERAFDQATRDEQRSFIEELLDRPIPVSPTIPCAPSFEKGTHGV